MSNIQHIVTLSTNNNCAAQCDRFNNSAADDVNNYIQEHGY